MARYTPQFLAVLRHRYEQTSQSERGIAHAFGLPATTLRGIAHKEGWVRPFKPVRDLEPAMWLREQAIALEQAADKRHIGPICVLSQGDVSQCPSSRYAPRLLAALRWRYEQTTQSVRSIAREFGLSDRTLRRIAVQEGWRRPEQAPRDLDAADRLLEEATALERRYLGIK